MFVNKSTNYIVHVYCSSSDPDQIKVSDTKDNTVTFTHTYEVYNKGPSPLPPTLFIIDVPVQEKNRRIWVLLLFLSYIFT